MRIAVLTEHFTKDMGYIENKLPSALARLGHEVHVISSDLQANHHLPDYDKNFARFHGTRVQKCGIDVVDGFTLHRLPHSMLLGHVCIKGLAGYLRRLKADVVQVHATSTWLALQAAMAQPWSGYLLFTGSHQTASIFSPKVKRSGRLSLCRLGSDLRRALPGRVVSLFAEMCYAATEDCGEIAVKYYGVPRSQIDVCSLGVDTDYAFPIARDPTLLRDRERIRREFGFANDEIVCVYTGKMTDDKNPLILAKVIADLRSVGHHFKGLFIGEGPQSREISSHDGCVVHGFVPARELPSYYRAADVGVWPFYESMSMLDAAACGIPIVVNHTVVATERWNGNGLTYRMGDADSLADSICRLCDPELRRSLGECGARKVAEHFSWNSIARRRAADYERAVSRKGRRGPIREASAGTATQ